LAKIFFRATAQIQARFGNAGVGVILFFLQNPEQEHFKQLESI